MELSKIGEMDEQPFTQEEVEAALGKLAKDKALGRTIIPWHFGFLVDMW